MFFLPLKLFLFKYWKPLAIVFGAIALVGFIYWKGMKRCEEKQAVRDAKEVVVRIEAKEDVKRKYEELRKKTPKHTTSTERDAYYSCMLSSSSPLTANCD